MAHKGTLILSDLHFNCIIGVRPRERIHLQEVQLTVRLTIDLESAAVSDDLKDTLDYSVLEEELRVCVEESRYRLIERLAQAVCDCCLTHTAVEMVELSLTKPKASRYGSGITIEYHQQRK